MTENPACAFDRARRRDEAYARLMGAPRLVQTLCPHCGAAIRIEPKADIVTCAYCDKSSVVHRPRQPVAPAPPDHGHIYLQEAAVRAVTVAVVVPLVGFVVLVVAGVVAALVFLRSEPTPPPAPALSPPPPAPTAAANEDDCTAAVACCKVVMGGLDPGQTRACNAVAALPVDQCRRQLESFRKSAQGMGRSCP